MTIQQDFYDILSSEENQGDIIPFFNTSPIIDNPYPYFDELQKRSPVLWMNDRRYENGGFYIITGYHEIREVLQNPSFGHKVTNLEAYVRKSKLSMNEFISKNRSIESVTNWMLTKNQPDHRSIRKIFSSFFSQEAISHWEPSIIEFVENELNEQGLNGTIEFVQFFKNITLKVISSIIGFPLSDFNKIRQWTDKLVWLLIGRDMPKSERQMVNVTVERMFNYVKQLITDEEVPEVSILYRIKDLSDRELHSIIHNVIFISFAGYETTTSLLSNLVYEFTKNSDLLNQYDRSNIVMEDVINEMLRLESPVQRISRSSLEPTNLGGEQISEGMKLQLLLGAGNRDNRVFSDPNSFILNRKGPNHLSFGGGFHYCLGSRLAIYESLIICQVLLDKITKFSLIETPKYRQNFTIRGFDTLHIAIE